MDNITNQKFTDITDRIIIVCKRQKITYEDFFIFYNYFNFLKESNINPIDSIYIAEALINAKIDYLNDDISIKGGIQKQIIAEAKGLLKNYYTKNTGQDAPHL